MTDPAQLIDGYLDGTLTPEQLQQLESDLADEPRYADAFAVTAMIDVLLSERFERDTIAKSMQLSTGDFLGEQDVLVLQQGYDNAKDEDDDEPELPTIHIDSSRPLTRKVYVSALSYVIKHTFTPKRVAVLATAAALLLGVVLTVVLLSGQDQDEPIAEEVPPNTGPVVATHPIVATLTNEHDAQWQTVSGQTAPAIDDNLLAGQHFNLTAGFAEITTNHGAVLRLEAPARVEMLDSDNAIRLTRGKLIGICETDSSKGLLVRTPAGDVIDIGTVFGVEVMSDTRTEVQVVTGKVKLAPRNPAGGLERFVELTAGNAARLDKTTAQVTSIQARPDRFATRSARTIDLVDAVAGGNGTTGKRNAGVNPKTGKLHNQPMDGADWHLVSDQKFRAAAANPLVAGTFIPEGDGATNQIDPAGTTFDRFPSNRGRAFGLIWAGGSIPTPEGDPKRAAVFDGIDYTQPGRGLVSIHSNTGVCFDLAEVWRRYPGMTKARFKTRLTNREAEYDRRGQAFYASVDVWVFVDGDLRFSRSDITTKDGLIEIDVPLSEKDNYLTLVITEGKGEMWFDWVLLLEPRLVLSNGD